tara:strand:+ start:331 stop:543 length:213 start_codon:yes stop_codon:yes gene_type:complete
MTKSGASRGAKKINIWGGPNEFTPKHGAGGYYAPHIKGKEDPDKGKTKRQRKINRRKPLPGGYPNIDKVG